MSPKTRLLLLVIIITAMTVVFFQTVYRFFYQAFPWSVNAYHTVKYPASLAFIHPTSQSILMIITGAVIILIILAYYPKDTQSL
jgi:hypothetical protein